MSSFLLNPRHHREVLSITLPMTLSGLSTPLLGMVDTAVMGHLDSAVYLGAVAVGALVLSFLFWGLVFLRMSVTGLTAQAFGANDVSSLVGTLNRGVVLATAVGLAIIVLQQPIINIALWFLDTGVNLQRNVVAYLEIRLLSAPATLINYVLLGWYLGVQRPRNTLYLLLLINGVNIFLDILFVVAWGWQVEGVAWASVLAEYLGALLGAFLIYRELKRQSWQWQPLRDLGLHQFTALFRVSSNIIIRTYLLIGSFAFFTLQGAKFGEATLAANAVLMNFQAFMAHGLDGFAHAAEALVGKYLGQKNTRQMYKAIVVCAVWSFVIALGFSATYYFFGEAIIHLLTDITDVRSVAIQYLPWAIIAPFVSVWGYLFDGIFIGAAWAAAMRNTMLISTALFLVFWFLSTAWGNHGLWFALMTLMLFRGLSMFIVFRMKWKQLVRECA